MSIGVAERTPTLGEAAPPDALLLSVMGSPDSRQIDGIGGADPLTSKVAVVSVSERADADIEYLFLQVFVDRAIVTDRQNCGNILSGVAQFANACVRLRDDPGCVTNYTLDIRRP